MTEDKNKPPEAGITNPGAESAEVTETPTHAGLDALRQETQNEVETAIARALETFGRIVKSGDFDLEGKNEAAKDAVREHLVKGLKNFFTENKSKAAEIIGSAKEADAQKLKNAFNEWMKEVGDFMQAEMEHWGGMTWGEMGIPEAEAALAAMKDPTAKGESDESGVGSFEQWISTHATYGEAYKERTAHTAAVAQSKPEAEKALGDTITELEAMATWPGFKSLLDKVRGDIAGADTPEKIASTAASLTAIKALRVEILPLNKQALEIEGKMNPIIKVLPSAIEGEMQTIKTNIMELTDGTKVAAIATNLTGIGGKISQYEPLAPYLTSPEIPDSQREAIAKQVKEGGRTPEQAIEDFEKAKKQTATHSAREFEGGEQAPFFDKAMQAADKMPEGKWKKIAVAFLATIGTLVASLARLPWIGNAIRKSLMSNRMLAQKYKDPEAMVAYKAEEEFTKFGLPTSPLIEIGGMETKEFVAILSDPDAVKEKLTTDEKLIGKYAHLKDQLEKKGGTLSEVTVNEFLGNNADWVSVKYKPEQAVATAAPSPNPAPVAPAVAVAPAPAPTAASTPAPIVTNPPAPPAATT